MARFVKRAPGGQAGGVVRDVPDDPWMPVSLPAIWEYLTLDTHDDGKARQRSTLMVLVEDGTVKCCLNDRDQSRSMWVAGDTTEGALEALEAVLASGEGIWRKYQPFKKQQKKGG